MNVVREAIPIGEVLAPRNETVAPADYPEMPYIGLDDIEAHSMRLLGSKPAASMKSSAKRFYPGDVLYARLRPYLNKVWPSDRNGICSSEFIVMPGNKFVDHSFLAFRLNAMDFVSFSNSLNAGDRPRVDFDQISTFCLPPFSLSRQHRIVAKIQELFSELDNGIENLKAARAKLDVYRQAVLKHAFEGKLTARWREENKDNLETPEQLLGHIQQERDARYEQQLTAWNASSANWDGDGQKGHKPKRPLKPKSLSPLTSDNLTRLPPLPTGWLWVRIGEIGLVGTGLTPLKSTSKYYVGGDIAWVTSGALNDPFVSYPTGYVTGAALNETNLRIYPPHTLVVALYGEGKTRGKCSELRIESTINQAIAAIVQEGTAEGLRDLLKWFLTKNYEEVRTGSSGGVQPNLNLGIIENSPVPICSIAEAEEVVKGIKRTLSRADELEEALVARLQQSDILRQSILKKAFTGQLVPQDPDDEPAAVLLKRIKAEKAARSQDNTRAKRRRTAAMA